MEAGVSKKEPSQNRVLAGTEPDNLLRRRSSQSPFLSASNWNSLEEDGSFRSGLRHRRFQVGLRAAKFSDRCPFTSELAPVLWGMTRLSGVILSQLSEFETFWPLP